MQGLDFYRELALIHAALNEQDTYTFYCCVFRVYEGGEGLIRIRIYTYRD